MFLTSKRRRLRRIRSLPSLVNLMLKASSFPSRASTHQIMHNESTLRLPLHPRKPQSTITQGRNTPLRRVSRCLHLSCQRQTLRLNKSKDLVGAEVTCMRSQHASGSCSKNTPTSNTPRHTRISGSASSASTRAYSEVLHMLSFVSTRSRTAENGNVLPRSGDF